MERTIISWNLANWITVMLMAAAGYALVGFVAQVMQRRTAGGGAVGGF